MPPMQRQKLDMLNSTTKSKLTTDPLEDAMRELIDVCQQYNDNISTKRHQQQQLTPNSGKSFNNNNNVHEQQNCTKFAENPYKTVRSSNSKSNNNNNNNCSSGSSSSIDRQCPREGARSLETCDKSGCNGLAKHPLTSQETKAEPDENKLRNMASSKKEDSIDRLRSRQSELQAQLDEVLEIAKQLDARQKRKFKCILEPTESRHQTPAGFSKACDNGGQEEDDDDDELIEFQQIENELRISELNRQLGNIQEELRLRLYKQLLSNTKKNGSAVLNLPSKQSVELQHQNLLETRRDSVQTDEAATPSYSSCSEEQATTISLATTTSNTTSSYSVATSDSASNVGAPSPAVQLKASDSVEDQGLPPPQPLADCKRPQQIELETARNSAFAQQAADLSASRDLLPTTSNGLGEPRATKNLQPDQYNLQAFDPATFNAIYGSNLNSLNLNNHRGPTSDLERIDEDDEDVEGYYGDSDRFRSIYEEKLSPIIRASTGEDSKLAMQMKTLTVDQRQQHCTTTTTTRASHDDDAVDATKQHRRETKTPERTECDYRFNSFANVNSQKRSNRPLTLYLPRPGEEINLHEHIQTLGHDLEILANDLVVESGIARGYLYKSCSNNSKKWLKRYFLFDRKAKVLAYYENEAQLVKKNCTPKNSVPFEEISDVYVDHKLSGFGERELSAGKKTSFVFILATVTRKYKLASARAEAMRAWIDILFTAARANDYSDHLANDNGNEFDFQDC